MNTTSAPIDDEAVKTSKKARFDPKINKLKELNRKVEVILGDEKGKVTRKKPFQKPLFERDLKKSSGKTTMTGLSQKGREGDGLKLGGGDRGIVSVTQYLKNLDIQLLMMSKTDENLIERLK